MGKSKTKMMMLFLWALMLGSCTQETQNRISKSIQNWTGTDGVLDIMSEGKVLYRFIKIDKLTTATATNDPTTARAFRFGYGVFDKNFDYIANDDEKKVYFEVSDYSTSYVFYESPVDD